MSIYIEKFVKRVENIKPLLFRGCLKEAANRLKVKPTRVYNVLQKPLVDWKVLEVVEEIVREKYEQIENSSPKDLTIN